MNLKIKRILDIMLSIILLILLIPLFIIIIVGLKINKVEKVVFSQIRTGKDNKLFNIYKFRTIYGKKENKFCSFLRRTGLDELPQLINILKGEMSFVGPRPWIVDYSKYFTKKQFKRLNVLPGLTGLAQVTNCKDIFDKINKDIQYINNISLSLDIKIILKTIKLVFMNNKKEINETGIEQEINLLKKQKR